MVPSLQAALRAAGAGGEELAELDGYAARRFEAVAGAAVTIPLADEPLAAPWAAWAEEARTAGAAAVLRRVLPQLSFPIREGISRTAAYRDATLRGVPPERLPEAEGLPLERPQGIELELYRSIGGGIPILTVRQRADFVTLVQALAHRNEPVPIPASQGAAIVGGLNNWERIRALRRRWEARPRRGGEAPSWAVEWQRLQARRELYQDRLIVLGDGPYSGVPAAEMGFGEEEWLRLSLTIRRDHECTHYFTRRAYGSMRNHLLDELLADYAGISAAAGAFRADWFLRFLGLGGGGHGRPGRRFEIYRGDPPLSDGALRVLETVAEWAARNLESCEHTLRSGGPPGGAERASMVLALATLGLDDLAAPEGPDRLARAYAAVAAERRSRVALH